MRVIDNLFLKPPSLKFHLKKMKARARLPVGFGKDKIG
jgi:hypothetical protein